MTTLKHGLMLACALALTACGPSDLEVSLTEQNKVLSTDTERLKGELTTAQQAVIEGKTQLEKLQSDLTAAQSEIAAATTARQGLEQRVAATEKAKTDAEAQLAELKTSLEAAKADAERRAAELATSTKSLEAAGRELEALKARHAEVETKAAQLGTTNQGLTSTLSALETQQIKSREELTVKAKAFEEASSELQSLKARLQEMEAKSTQLSAENQKLAGKLSAVTAERSNLSAEQKTLQTEVVTTGKDLDQAKQRVVDLNKSYGVLLAEKDKLVSTSAKRKAELEDARKALEAAQEEVARLAGARGIYTVQEFDSLSSIAAFFYRDGARWPDVYKANSFIVKNPDHLDAGMVLIIPK